MTKRHFRIGGTDRVARSRDPGLRGDLCFVRSSLCEFVQLGRELKARSRLGADLLGRILKLLSVVLDSLDVAKRHGCAPGKSRDSIWKHKSSRSESLDRLPGLAGRREKLP